MTGDPVPVAPIMPAGHYSRPTRTVTHDIRFRVRLAFTGPSPAQYAWLGAHCLTCPHTQDIGADRSLPDLIRWYAQHAGRDAVALVIAETLASIGPEGQDL